MKAYKATEKNMQCLGFQFEMNKEFIQSGEIGLCYNGFHFCKDLNDVFRYYGFSPKHKHRFFEVEIPDDAKVIHGENKSVTNKIKFIRELLFEEIKELTGGDVYIDTDGGYVYCGNKYFYNENGRFHREDGPAIVYANGTQFWYQNDKPHREDGPAVICADSYQAWWQNGKLHREDGPAIIRADDDQSWWQNGVLHRVDGPAIVCKDGYQSWCQNGLLHRDDGPAVIYANGVQQFWINGVFQK